MRAAEHCGGSKSLNGEASAERNPNYEFTDAQFPANVRNLRQHSQPIYHHRPDVTHRAGVSCNNLTGRHGKKKPIPPRIGFAVVC